ncbi:MAG TPA: ATP synthase F1 subunit epsilon [Mucilaginibacter sp.]|nr:ATP synthase F1 subunit epsilon [Mucilaginibacter sp.]HVW14052.1 ATP synthase F1 subunit epsilon [Mucilaginibacter sp.]
MTLEILTPDKKVYEGEISSVNLPGTMGGFEILSNHAPIISTLEDGKVVVHGGGKEEIFVIHGGVVECLNNHVIVLAEGISAKQA